ncbi:hypothetical protein [Gracilibacillus thailandensis]|uniref:Replicative helicase inhibitor G39P N-terminal domain-containing protein n=1 Tax=Gracilibacillus thailandensis TaxID=563735 RepID=A0A6N7QWN2_9BACI|nr:hypothetical protein [Gracilibacillus thailandensis]MRI65130.1 hypothetical protein [Gracilibacillus thailandensis]
MLDKQLFREKMKELMIYYPNWNFEVSDKNLSLWYERFKDHKEKKFIKMIDDYIDNETFNPTIAGLLKYYLPEPKKTLDQIRHEEMLRENGML